jgi:hypothetical protein
LPAVWVAWIATVGWMFGTHRWGSLPAVADACSSPAPDVRFAPPPQATLSFIHGCRSRGAVGAYAHLQVLDLGYPTLVAAALALTLLALTSRRPRLRWLAVIPAIASFGDYVENAGAWTLISGRDPTWALQAVQAGSFTKTTLSWCAWLAVITLLGAQLIARMSRPRAHASATPRQT